ncbi:ATP-binding protein [Pseudactinotalea sp.]|uniref:HAMP domain-containing sensor histidine kinase n=1 Tax=Pseudactinotalea sp. TaxID=1926260 RepID=UPI003B3B33EB
MTGTERPTRQRVRHARSDEPSWRNPFPDTMLDLRPLDPVRSVKGKLIVIIGATVTMYMLVTWLGDQLADLGVLRTFPLALVSSLIVTQLLARGMTRPLREMTAAARAMARGDYSIRVQTNSRDEVGQLAAAFNSMAGDLDALDSQRREMVANVSHELRTPVAALRAQVENMADGVIEPDPEALEAALAQIERLSRLIAYLLDLSRLEAGAAALHVAPIAVEEFLRSIVSDSSRASARTDLRWEVETKPADLTVVGDEERLRQVVSNLLDNASRHSPDGGTVTLRSSTTHGYVVIDVIDEGHGIPEADRDQVFGRFQRGNAPAQTGGSSTGGTGLGLAIARWAVGLHEGTIAVIDPVGGVGTRIRVRLPADGPRTRVDGNDTLPAAGL